MQADGRIFTAAGGRKKNEIEQARPQIIRPETLPSHQLKNWPTNHLIPICSSTRLKLSFRFFQQTTNPINEPRAPLLLLTGIRLPQSEKKSVTSPAQIKAPDDTFGRVRQLLRRRGLCRTRRELQRRPSRSLVNIFSNYIHPRHPKLRSKDKDIHQSNSNGNGNQFLQFFIKQTLKFIIMFIIFKM